MYKRRRILLIGLAVLSAVSLLFPAEWISFVKLVFFPLLSHISSLSSLPVFAVLPVIPIFLNRRQAIPSYLIMIYAFIILWLPFHVLTPSPALPLEKEALISLYTQIASSLPETPPASPRAEDIPSLSFSAVKRCFPSRNIGAEPKLAKFGKLYKMLNIAGIFIPLTGEAVISSEEPLFLMPFTACHELAHRLGYANEGMANYIAFSVLINSENDFLRYSGAITALRYAILSLGRESPKEAIAFAKALPEYAQHDLIYSGAFIKENQDTRAFPRFAGDYADILPLIVSNMNLFRLPPSDPTALSCQ